MYLIWFGPQVSENSIALGQNIEGGILGEVAIRSGGEIIRVTEELGSDGNLGLVNTFLFSINVIGYSHDVLYGVYLN